MPKISNVRFFKQKMSVEHNLFDINEKRIQHLQNADKMQITYKFNGLAILTRADLVFSTIVAKLLQNDNIFLLYVIWNNL